MVRHLPPLTQCAQREDGHNGSTPCCGKRAEQDPQSAGKPTVTVALDCDESVPDQSTGESSDENRRKGQHPGTAGRERREWAIRFTVGGERRHALIVGRRTVVPPSVGLWEH